MTLSCARQIRNSLRSEPGWLYFPERAGRKQDGSAPISALRLQARHHRGRLPDKKYRDKEASRGKSKLPEAICTRVTFGGACLPAANSVSCHSKNQASHRVSAMPLYPRPLFRLKRIGTSMVAATGLPPSLAGVKRQRLTLFSAAASSTL